MRKLNVIIFLAIFIICISGVVYATEVPELEVSGIVRFEPEPPTSIPGFRFEIEGKKPQKINDEFNILLNYEEMSIEGGPTFTYDSIDCSIKYPKNKVEFISTEINPDMYVIRNVPEESEFGYIDCCVTENVFSSLKFKFKVIASGEMNFVADIESVYGTRFPAARPPVLDPDGNELPNEEPLVLVKRFSDVSEELVVEIPLKNNILNMIQIDENNDTDYYLTGIEEKTTLGNFLSYVSDEYEYSTFISKNENENFLITSSNENLLKTGDTIIIAKKEPGKDYFTGIKRYKIIIYGDTNGDGMINSGDALAIVKNKTNAIPFTEYEFKEAGRVQEKDRGTEAVPSAIDALMIIKHKLGKYKIVQ